jgi:hypothetical protein
MAGEELDDEANSPGRTEIDQGVCNFRRFYRIHKSLPVTPAMESKLMDHVWDFGGTARSELDLGRGLSWDV